MLRVLPVTVHLKTLKTGCYAWCYALTFLLYAALYCIVMQSQWYQNQIPEVFHTPNICIYVFKNSDNQSQNAVAQPLFFLKNSYSSYLLPIPHLWNCSDGCLLHLAHLKLKKSTLKLGERVCATIFVGDCS